jgi:DnaK suppressor protein
MARREALLRLHKSLVARRDELRRRLGGELKDLRNTTFDTGDTADQAFDAGSEEVSSQLAQLESRELSQIERALARLKQGIYGQCEGCQKKIPVSRLNALPYSTTCVGCQQEFEHYGTWGGRGKEDWDKVADHGGEETREVNLSELEFDVSSSR